MSDSGSNSAGPWRIQLFGALVVQRPTGERVRMAGKKAGELLAYLALQPDRAHSRERLISLLWDGAEISSGPTRLRQEILKLRTQFAADTDPFPLLIITPDELQIHPDAWIDAVRLVAACSEAKRAADGETKRRLFAEVRHLYRSDLLQEPEWYVRPPGRRSS